MGRRWKIAAVILLFAIGASELYGKVKATRDADAETQKIIAAIEKNDAAQKEAGGAVTAESQMLVFKRRYDFYPLVRSRPDLAARGRYLNFDDTCIANLPALTVFERDMWRRVEKFYNIHAGVGQHTLAKQLPVTIIAPTFEQWELGEMFPDCYFEPVDETLLVVKPN
jgi:hypothetical protein